MPQVPRIDGPQVRQEAISNFKVRGAASVENFGGGAGNRAITEATQGLGRVVDDIYQKEKNKADDLATQEAYAKLVKKKNDLVYNPETGLMNRKGKDAFGAVDDGAKSFDSFADEIENGLSSAEQKAMFRNIRLREKTELDGSLQRHVFGEARAYDEETTNSSLSAAREDAVLNYLTPGKIEESIRTQQAIAMSHADRQGMGEDWIKLKNQEVASNTHAAVIERMMNTGNDLAAQKYFETNKGSFTAKDVSRLEAVMEEGSLRGESQRQSDLIMKQGLGMSGAMKAAKEIENPKLRDEVVRRLQGEFAIKDAMDRDREEKMFLDATNIIEKTGRFEDIPASRVAQMPLSMRSQLKNYAQQKQQGVEIEPNSQAYYDLKTMAAMPETRNEFLKANLLQYKGKIRETELKEMIDIQSDARNGGGKGMAQLDGFLTDMQTVNGVLAEISVKPDSDEAKKFYAMLDKQVAQVQMSTGKKVTNEELRKMANVLGTEVVTDKGWLWDSSKRVFELEEADEIQEVDISAVPPEEKKKIKEAIARNGGAATDSAVVDLYKRNLLRKRSAQ